MTDVPRRKRCIIASYARDDAYLPLCRVVLARMGYAIVTAEHLDPVLEELGLDRPHIRLVDERRLAEVPEDRGRRPVPMVLLTGRHGVVGADPRIVGAVKRPVGLHELFRVIQQVAEDYPRATPRIPTNLPATCRRGEREWQANVLSLSENGCLLRTPEPVPLGSHLQLSFDLPRVGTISTEAESAYQIVPDLGLVFNGIPAAAREAIASFVTRTLATA